MTREEAIEMIKHILWTMPKEPPTECDYIEEWFDENKKVRKALDMAIKTLGQKPILDKIRAEIVQIYGEIDTVSHNEYENAVEQGKERAYENVLDIIDKYNAEDELPPVTTEQKWIPVCERLPEERQIVLVTRTNGVVEIISWNQWWFEQKKPSEYQTIAWIPLPKPYKAESEDKE